MTDKLKPCPFCGRKPTVIITPQDGVPSGDAGTSVTIKCECHAMMKFWALKREWVLETAEKSWNRRAENDR